MNIALRRSRRPDARTVPAALFLIALGLAAYWNSLRGEFIFDDVPGIVLNRTIRDLSDIRQVLSPPTGGFTVSGRPILNLSLAVDYALAAKDSLGRPAPQPFHVTNLAIHLLAGLLLFGVVRRSLLLPGIPASFARASAPLAAAVAAAWLVHPLQTEAVTYAIQRAESLVSFFYLLTLYALIRLGTGGSAWFWWLVGIAAGLAGMGSKEVMVSAPLAALLYDRAFLAGSFRAAWRRRWKFHLSLAAGWILLAILLASTGGRGGTAGVGAGDTVGWWEYARSQFGVIVHYLSLTFWPARLTLDYEWPVASTWQQIVPPALAVAALLAAAAWALWKKPRWALLGVLFFLALAPTSSVIPIADLAFEHRMYLPLAGLLTLLVVGAYALLDRLTGARALRVAACVLFAGILAGLAWRTSRRNIDYRTELSIWQANVAANPHGARGFSNFGAALCRQAQVFFAQAQQAAMDSRQLLLDGHDGPARSKQQLASDLLARARRSLDDSERFYLRAIRENSGNFEARLGLGTTYLWQGEVAKNEGPLTADRLREHRRWLVKAMDRYREAARLAPRPQIIQKKLQEAEKILAEIDRELESAGRSGWQPGQP